MQTSVDSEYTFFMSLRGFTTSSLIPLAYLPIFEMEGKVLAAELICDPKDWYQSIFRYHTHHKHL